MPRAIDELEHAVAASYRPGEGLVGSGPAAGRGSADDHVRAASALLTAFEMTGRLPYSMLAEELIAVIAAVMSPTRTIAIALSSRARAVPPRRSA